MCFEIPVASAGRRAAPRPSRRHTASRCPRPRAPRVAHDDGPASPSHRRRGREPVAPQEGGAGIAPSRVRVVELSRGRARDAVRAVADATARGPERAAAVETEAVQARMAIEEARARDRPRGGAARARAAARGARRGPRGDPMRLPRPQRHQVRRGPDHRVRPRSTESGHHGLPAAGWPAEPPDAPAGDGGEGADARERALDVQTSRRGARGAEAGASSHTGSHTTAFAW